MTHEIYNNHDIGRVRKRCAEIMANSNALRGFNILGFYRFEFLYWSTTKP